jgi:hypothetical protein
MTRFKLQKKLQTEIFKLHFFKKRNKDRVMGNCEEGAGGKGRSESRRS